MAGIDEIRRGAQRPHAGLAARWPALEACPQALEWLQMLTDLGRSPRTVDAYARGLADHLGLRDQQGRRRLALISVRDGSRPGA